MTPEGTQRAGGCRLHCLAYPSLTPCPHANPRSVAVGPERVSCLPTRAPETAAESPASPHEHPPAQLHPTGPSGASPRHCSSSGFRGVGWHRKRLFSSRSVPQIADTRVGSPAPHPQPQGPAPSHSQQLAICSMGPLEIRDLRLRAPTLPTHGEHSACNCEQAR